MRPLEIHDLFSLSKMVYNTSKMSGGDTPVLQRQWDATVRMLQGRSGLKRRGVASREEDLRRYLEHKRSLFPPEITQVVAAVNTFASSILREGLQTAITQLQVNIDNRPDRPFIEVSNEIIEHHLQLVKPEDRELVGKSLFEAYVYLAGPQHVFEPANKTRIVSFLQRHGTKGFVGMFLSLHLFNLTWSEIQDDVRATTPDQKSFELCMVEVETVCRGMVTAAMKIPDTRLDEQWAAAVCANIENRLLQRP